MAARRVNDLKSDASRPDWRKSWQMLTKEVNKEQNFTAKLPESALEYFSEVAKKPFGEQAVAFLNAYWPEVGDQAEFIFAVSYEWIKKSDMHAKGVSLIHQYTEGCDLDFDIGLYFYEQLCKFLENPGNKQWVEPFAKSQPVMMTSLTRKQELRDKVDVNFDGRISFLEYLLYQYKDFANPADFCQRSMGNDEEHPEVRAARLALEEVMRRIKEFEAEKAKLEANSQLDGVKGLRAKNLLAQLLSGPLAQDLNAALINAEAKVRIATKKFGSGSGSSGEGMAPTAGAIWWMNRDLDEKKKRYGNVGNKK